MDVSMTFLIYLYTLIWRYAVRVYMLYVYMLHGVRLNGQYGSWSTYSMCGLIWRYNVL